MPFDVADYSIHWFGKVQKMMAKSFKNDWMFDTNEEKNARLKASQKHRIQLFGSGV